MDKKESLKNINPRVYRRSLEDIIILWNTKNLDDSQKSIIRLSVYNGPVKVVGDNDWQDLHFISDTRRERVQGFDRNTAIAVIPYKENELNADIDYRFRITLGAGTGIIEVEIPIYRFGTLPDSIKDDVKYISQVYGYVTKDRKWKKITLIEKNGILGIPVFIMNLDELLEKHNNK